MITDYHAKYFAYNLTRKCSSDSLEKLNSSIFNASVDLNPHQIDAALFAFQSPLSRGAILADEVGLGKTIEAGLIISQLWAERKRRILCIVPASLRHQWAQELLGKFFINSIILETKNFNQFIKAGNPNPFDQGNRVIICSYNFARSKSHEIISLSWNLVVIDEAHRLRNVYKKGNKIAQAIRNTVGTNPKVLLTATPLQNSLMELFGLLTFLDPHIFGNEESFRAQFMSRVSDTTDRDFQNLRRRLQPICKRTLRRQVTEYIRYTNRVSITQDFTPTDEEIRLYDAVSTYLQRQDSFALPSGQRSLMTLVLRKILASSSFAISITLGSFVNRLEAMHRAMGVEQPLDEVLEGDFELTEELQEEWVEAGDEAAPSEEGMEQAGKDELALKIQAIRQEADELKNYRTLAESITRNAKGEALLTALKIGFKKLSEFGAPQKALVFTESRRTQRYLYELLSSSGYAGQIVMLNGTNTEQPSQEIYMQWRERHKATELITGSKSVDMRVALVEEFEKRASIMIATETGAEGLNFQFCCLVVNYDLPWNPQRIEQRIGRCHRYGQKFDVVVINFINRKNAADQRVFQLLAEKLQLFEGVFGASDEVLGALESGVDFERRIHEIYQSCRTSDEINRAFDQLQQELDEQIRAKMEDARTKLLENFDEDVHKKLRVSRDETQKHVGLFEEWLWKLSRYELGDCAEFGPYTFKLKCPPQGMRKEDAPLGNYRLVIHKNGEEDHRYRLGHPLAEHIINAAKGRPLTCKEMTFFYNPPPRVALVENLRGKSGCMKLHLLSVEALEVEEYLIFTAQTDDGQALDNETCAKLFSLDGVEGAETEMPDEVIQALDRILEAERSRLTADISERNKNYFSLEMEKMDNWAEDQKEQLETELKQLDKDIKALKKDARQEGELEKKVELHKQAKDLERKRTEKRRSLFDAQDEVDRKKDELIGQVEARLKQKTQVQEVFALRWNVV